jgi:hypothetical protein
MFNQDELDAFVGGLLEKKNYSTFSDAELEDIKRDLVERLIAQLEIALVDELPDEKANELTDRLNNGGMTDEEIGNFMRENGVNIEEITSKTKEQFENFFMMEVPFEQEAETEGEQ